MLDLLPFRYLCDNYKNCQRKVGRGEDHIPKYLDDYFSSEDHNDYPDLKMKLLEAKFYHVIIYHISLYVCIYLYDMWTKTGRFFVYHVCYYFRVNILRWWPSVHLFDISFQNLPYGYEDIHRKSTSWNKTQTFMKVQIWIFWPNIERSVLHGNLTLSIGVLTCKKRYSSCLRGFCFSGNLFQS